MISLLIKNKKSIDEPKTFTFNQKLIKIGRLKENDITLKDISVSRQHAVISFVDGEYKITDTSKNGTFLNGELIGNNNEKILRSGDNIQISNFVINVEIEDQYDNFEKTSDLIQHRFSDSSLPASNSLFPYIEVTGGVTSGERYEFVEDFEEIILGRAPDCDIQIPHKSVSKSHAKIVKRKNEFELVDLNSSNGVFLNDKKVNGSITLKDRDEIVLGQSDEKDKIKIIFINQFKKDLPEDKKETKEGKIEIKEEKKEYVENPPQPDEGQEELKKEAEKEEVKEEKKGIKNSLDVTNINIDREEILNSGAEKGNGIKFSIGEYALIGIAILLGIITLIIIVYSVLT